MLKQSNSVIPTCPVRYFDNERQLKIGPVFPNVLGGAPPLSSPFSYCWSTLMITMIIMTTVTQHNYNSNFWVLTRGGYCEAATTSPQLKHCRNASFQVTSTLFGGLICSSPNLVDFVFQILLKFLHVFLLSLPIQTVFSFATLMQHFQLSSCLTSYNPAV